MHTFNPVLYEIDQCDDPEMERLRARGPGFQSLRVDTGIDRVWIAPIGAPFQHGRDAAWVERGDAPELAADAAVLKMGCNRLADIGRKWHAFVLPALATDQDLSGSPVEVLSSRIAITSCAGKPSRAISSSIAGSRRPIPSSLPTASTSRRNLSGSADDTSSNLPWRASLRRVERCDDTRSEPMSAERSHATDPAALHVDGAGTIELRARGPGFRSLRVDTGLDRAWIAPIDAPFQHGRDAAWVDRGEAPDLPTSAVMTTARSGRHRIRCPNPLDDGGQLALFPELDLPF